MLALSDSTHLVLHQMTYREKGFLQLPVVYLRQKVGLVFHGVGTCGEPFSAVDNLGLCIMSSGNQVILMSAFLMKSPEFDKPVAHHIRIRCETVLHLIHGITRDIVPILTMAIYNLELTSIATRHGSSHLEVFL